jgi:hypothetical protein
VGDGGSDGETDNPGDVTINTPTEDVGSDRPLTPEETDAPADVGVREDGGADSVSDGDADDDRPDMNTSTPGRDGPSVDNPGDVGVRDGALGGRDDTPDVVVNGPNVRDPSIVLPGELPTPGLDAEAAAGDGPQDVGVRFGGRDGQGVAAEIPRDLTPEEAAAGFGAGDGTGGLEGEAGSDDPSVRPNLGGVGSGIRIDPRLVKDAIKDAKDGGKS